MRPICSFLVTVSTSDILIEFTDDSFISSMERFGEISDWQIINMDEEPASKQDILDTIKSMHIGEWRTRYTLERFGYHVCDGTQWELEIYFSNEHKPVKIYGDNAYPYNFDVLQELIDKQRVEDILK